MALQLDEVSNTARFFLDGVQAIETRLCTEDGGFQAVVDVDTSLARLQFTGFGLRV